MNDLDVRPKVVKGIVGGQCPSCMRVDFHIEGCPIIPRDREIIHRNQEVKSKVETIHELLAEVSALRAENERMKEVLQTIANAERASGHGRGAEYTLKLVAGAAEEALAPRGQEGEG